MTQENWDWQQQIDEFYNDDFYVFGSSKRVFKEKVTYVNKGNPTKRELAMIIEMFGKELPRQVGKRARMWASHYLNERELIRTRTENTCKIL